jgi:uncharacterized membrane protein YfcA
VTSAWRPGLSSRTAIFIALSAAAAYFVYLWIAQAHKTYGESSPRPTLLEIATGFVTDFLDTLGIGSFATTTAIAKFTRMVPDERIPGTLNVGHTLPTILEAFLYITLIEVDTKTLLLLIASSVVGAWWGAGVVSRLPRRAIQIGMGSALTISIGFLVMAELHWFPPGGERLSLSGYALLAGMAGTCLFGALGTLGIGFYAPCMILGSLLGMAPLAAFPIMMGSSAFLLPVASARFFERQSYEPLVALGLTLGGLPGVLVAAFLVKSLPLGALRWLVVAAAFWAAILLFRSALRGSQTPQ